MAEPVYHKVRIRRVEVSTVEVLIKSTGRPDLDGVRAAALKMAAENGINLDTWEYDPDAWMVISTEVQPMTKWLCEDAACGEVTYYPAPDGHPDGVCGKCGQSYQKEVKP